VTPKLLNSTRLDLIIDTEPYTPPPPTPSPLAAARAHPRDGHPEQRRPPLPRRHARGGQRLPGLAVRQRPRPKGRGTLGGTSTNDGAHSALFSMQPTQQQRSISRLCYSFLQAMRCSIPRAASAAKSERIRHQARAALVLRALTWQFPFMLFSNKEHPDGVGASPAAVCVQQVAPCTAGSCTSASLRRCQARTCQFFLARFSICFLFGSVTRLICKVVPADGLHPQHGAHACKHRLEEPITSPTHCIGCACNQANSHRHRASMAAASTSSASGTAAGPDPVHLQTSFKPWVLQGFNSASSYVAHYLNHLCSTTGHHCTHLAHRQRCPNP
jgi:hypothetical protein